MDDRYEQALEKAKRNITEASDGRLTAPTFHDDIFNSTKINLPKLDLENVNVEIKKEEVTIHNAPVGISVSISGPRLVEYAIYTLPVIGDIDLFSHLVRNFVDRRTVYIDSRNLYYKEYSNTNISGNEDIIDQIKTRVISLTDNIDKVLKVHAGTITEFHDTKLKPAIDEGIGTEISRRTLVANSETKLNPFRRPQG